MMKDVDKRSVKNCPNGIFKNMKRPAPNMASGTDPKRIMNGSRKLLNCSQDEKDQHQRKQKHAQKLAAFGLQLARLARVIEHVTFWQNLVCLILQKLQSSIERNGRNPTNGDRV